MPSSQTSGTANGVNGTTQHVYPLEELAWKVTKNASVVSQYLAASHLPQPAFEATGPGTVVPSDSPQYVQQARQNLIASALELVQLAVGPSEFLPHLATGYHYVACLHWLCQCDVFHIVPLDGSISYDDLATRSGVPRQRLKSILRMAMTTQLFREEPDGTIAHSATSALLARDEGVHAYAKYMCSRSAPTALAMPLAAARWGPGSTSTTETGYNVAFDTDLSFFDHLGQDKERTAEFATYMRNVRSSEAVSLKHLVAAYDWQSIADRDGLVVDVGGSTGTTAIALANKFPQLRLIVQDQEENAVKGQEAACSLPAEVRSRLGFQTHSFFEPQPVTHADAYLLRMILHDWPDAESVKIIRQLVAAIDGGASSAGSAIGRHDHPPTQRQRRPRRLLIMDTVLPEPGSVPVSAERIVRARDLTMLQAFNSQERDLADWRELLRQADPDLRLRGVTQPYGSAMSLLEVAKPAWEAQAEVEA